MILRQLFTVTMHWTLIFTCVLIKTSKTQNTSVSASPSAPTSNAAATSDSETLTGSSTVITTSGIIPSTTTQVTSSSEMSGTTLTTSQVTTSSGPHAISNLTAEALNTTTIKLQWQQPKEYQSSYSYQVQTSGCTSPTRSASTKEEIIIGSLPPGTKCTFSIYVEVMNGTRGKDVNISHYTKPEIVQPEILNTQTSDTITVRWSHPLGNVESYVVLLNSSNSSNRTSELNPNISSYNFNKLSAGKIYTATVTTKSGPYGEESKPVSNATYPNPPGNISINETTTNSISVEWAAALRMEDSDGFNYTVTISNSSGTRDYNTTSLYQNLTKLISGTAHTICVRTTGPFGFQSEPVCYENVTTRPHAISNLTAEALNTTTIKLQWQQPKEYQSSYSYQVQTSGCTSPTRSASTKEEIIIGSLPPGTKCTFSIYVEVMNGTRGKDVNISHYTKPEIVQPEILNTQTSDTITVRWSHPLGNVESYVVLLNSSNRTSELNPNISSYNFNKLSAGKIYTATVTTKSGPYGEESKPVSNATYPNPPGNISINETTTNSISVQWAAALRMEDSDGFNYTVTISNSSGTRDYNTTSLYQNLTKLISGTAHTICVRTTGPFGFQSEPVCYENVTTRPHAISNLTAEALNTTTIKLQWQQPKEYQSSYSYQVQTSGCTSPTRSASTKEEIIIGSLPPGTKCTFSIYVEVMNGTRGKDVNISHYTKPEIVQTEILNTQTSDTITVRWSHPLGNVESYVVLLNSSNSSNRTSELNPNISSYNFNKLSAGKIYTATVTTKSGPYGEESKPVSNATYPNPPGNISINETTTNSISVQWAAALRMEDSDGFNYTVTISNSSGTRDYNTTSLYQNLTKLISGTAHTICVRTTGPFGFQSEPVCYENVTTRPHAISNLTAEALNTTTIKLQWQQPKEYQSSYSYQVQTSGCTSPTRSASTKEEIIIGSLPPGTKCTFSIYVEVMNGTRGKDVNISHYTKPEIVQPEIVNTQTSDTITVRWSHPLGNVESYVVLLNSSNSSNRTSELNPNISSYNFNKLSAGKIYTATVTTKSGPYGEESKPVSNATYPNPPGNISINETTTNSISVEWAAALRMEDSDGFNYTVTISDSSGTRDYNTTSLYQNLTKLISGKPHTICVRTTGPFGFQSEPVCYENVTTRPHAISNLTAEALNTTTIKLQWQQPKEYQSSYSYQVQTSGCTSPTRSASTKEEIIIGSLPPGTKCTFSIYVEVMNGTRGKDVIISHYTKPETVQPEVLNKRTNDTITVRWSHPLGNVESYVVLLNSSNSSNRTSELNPNISSYNFNKLSAGKIYTATVTTKSGPYGEESKPVSNATYPNPPGNININETTTNSISVQWAAALRMEDSDGFNYTVTISNSSGTRDYNTTSLYQNLTKLISGTAHTICVRTTGPFGFQSEPVCYENVTTRPHAISNLTAEALNTTTIKLQWQQPKEYQSSYSYQVQTSGCTSPTRSTSTKEEIIIGSLPPGTKCTFSIYVEVMNGTRGKDVNISHYTKPETVQPEVLNKRTNDTITVRWSHPLGNVESYVVLLNSSNSSNRTSELNPNISSYNFNKLSAGKIYTATVTTKSGPYGEESKPVSNATYPNPPGNININETTTNSISVEWAAALRMEDSDGFNYTVTISNSSGTRDYNTTSLYQNLTKLISGTAHTICVRTTGPFGFQSEPVCYENVTTRPYAISSLTAEALNTTTIKLQWQQPKEYQSSYSYQVQTSGCTSSTRSASTKEEIIIGSLPPGTKCTFSIYVEVMNGTRGKDVNISHYTKPEIVQPEILNKRTNDTITVRWSHPLGNVESYVVLLNSSNSSNRTSELNPNISSYNFNKLSAGKIYTATVTTKSGPYGEESKPVSNATYPNPAGNISINETTTNSISVEWAAALRMEDSDGFNYTVTISDSSGTRDYNTTSLYQNLTKLISGKPHTICVRTTGPFGFQSEPVCYENVTTRPHAISNLTAEALNTTTIKLQWQQPKEYQSSYSYQVQTSGCTSPTRSASTKEEIIIGSLPPGTKCTFSIYVEVMNGTRGKDVIISHYTKPEIVQPEVFNKRTNDTITVRWSHPLGNVESYVVLLNSSNSSNRTSELNPNISSYNFTKLSAGKLYTATVTTKSGPYGEESKPVSNATYPNPPGNISINETTTNSISVEWAAALRMEDSDGFNYTVTISNSSGTRDYNTTSLYQNLANLISGITHIICVRTTGPFGFQSEPVCYENVTTRPKSVTSLKADVVSETCITWKWVSLDHKDGYSYQVNWTNEQNTSWNFGSNTAEQVFKLCSLSPGVRYNVSVTTLTHGTHGSPVENSICTDASGVTLECNGPNNTTNPELELKWDNPKGHNTGYIIASKTDLTDHSGNAKTCSEKCVYHIKNDLSYSTEYNVTIWTKGCGNWGKVSKICKTGVTDNVDITVAVGVTFGILVILLCVTIALLIFFKRRKAFRRPDSDIQINTIRAKTSVPVRVEEFDAYYKKQCANSKCGFAEEFEDLKPVGTALPTTTASALENKSKNRYNNVLPYEPSRVKLSILGSQFDDYINADYIPGSNSRKEFIATQGPLPATVNDFWRMIWEKNIRTIVMLTRCNEQGRVKCEQYWPAGSMHYNNIIVTTTSEIVLDDWTLRDFEIKNVKTAESRLVRQFHYTAWPDHGVPETTELLINFRHLVREHMNQYSVNSPTVVHCSAGVGRTGTFIAIDRIIFQIERESMVDVFGIVYDMRMHRPLMVQTEAQYVFLNQCALDIIKSRMGTNVDLIYQNTMASDIYENIKLNKS